MNKLSATRVAGVLLLLATAPAMAQGYYPGDPGYDQGQDAGTGEDGEVLPPGADYGPGPAYRGDPQGEEGLQDDQGDISPEDEPLYGGDGRAPYRRQLLRPFGGDFDRGRYRFHGGERQRVRKEAAPHRGDHDRRWPSDRRLHRLGQDGSDR